MLALTAGLAVAVALVVLAVAGSDGRAQVLPAPPPVTAAVLPPAAAAPAPGPAPVSPAPRAAARTTPVRVDRVARHFPLYDIAARTFGVPWVLLASIHKQETGFGTHPTTYRGLNFAGCCGGPMQFNVTNGEPSTWDRFQNAYRRAPRPADYPHRTERHPSIYDDFDAIMAAAWLLRTAGAGPQLDGSAWRAAYEYYGPDLDGVDYADRVTARAIAWSREGFCADCEPDDSLVASVAAAWGAPVRAQLMRRR